ncbi:MAG TPA: enoyl-CoA hydratase-related protein [Streptosporangiaceae bacterium]|nr:enoyl-CoA hydratase-related protein [Streptosporangiaceae bacterium]
MNAETDAVQVLRLERHGAVAIVTLNRPERLNALNRDLQDAIVDAMAEIRENDAIRAAVMVGAGRGFCSGADVRGAPSVAEDGLPQNARLDELGWVGRQAIAVSGLDKPTIAAVNGIAAGAGMSLALACDLRVGGAQAAFRSVFIERSLSPDAGLTYFLTRVVGYSRAADLVFTSRTVQAEEALQLGLLNRVVAGTDVLPAAVELADQIARWPPLALRASKRVLQHNLECSLPEALLYEKAGLKLAALAPDDRREAIQSFAERRPPVFTGH